MTWRQSAVLFGLGLAVNLFIASFQSWPGYMDADYYFAGGIQLATGRGFTEPYIWNYLSDPRELPTASHAYWMPLASLISAAGMWLTSQTTYEAGRWPFILLAAWVPVMTAALAFELSRRRSIGMAAGLLALGAHYYAPSLPVPDNYAVYMLLGAAFFLLAARTETWIPLALGILAGLMTLARSDGLLWVGLAGLVVLWRSHTVAGRAEQRRLPWVWGLLPAAGLVLLGYLLVMGPWHYRNLQLFGTPLTPGGARLLWLQDYRETFVYSPEQLTLERFVGAGWEAILGDRYEAFSANLNTAVFAQAGLFLLPFILIGLWRLRRDIRIQLAVTGWLILLGVMSLVFPFAGVRGSFFHAGAALQPVWWAAAPVGLEALLEWLRARGRFEDRYASVVFHTLLILMMFGFTAYLVNLRIFAQGWEQDDRIYAAVEQKLQTLGMGPEAVVVVRNPPGYYVRTRRPAILLPYGDEASLLAAAREFSAEYVVLEPTSSLGGLQRLYDNPLGQEALTYLGEVDGARLFQLAPEAP